MAKHRRTPNRRKRKVTGGGNLISSIINKAIDKLPFEAHLKGYNYCGPGTRLEERLARGDRGINPLDEACKIHDIAYARFKDSDKRKVADKELAERAWARVKSSDASLGEKSASWLVTTAMKLKSKIGGGAKRCKRKCGKRKRTGVKKKGGVLPLLPILAGLGALGSLAGGASAVAKTIIDSKNAKKQLEEVKRHNLALEGKGLYLRPYKKGGGAKKRNVKKKKFRSQ